MSTEISNTNKNGNDVNRVLVTGVFSRLGKYQKEIIKLMVEDDYYILHTFDTRDNSFSLDLEDEWGNVDRSLSDATLDKLQKRNILIKTDVSKCVELIQTKYSLNERYVMEALNACL